jgi:hypothetical protein
MIGCGTESITMKPTVSLHKYKGLVLDINRKRLSMICRIARWSEHQGIGWPFGNGRAVVWKLHWDMREMLTMPLGNEGSVCRRKDQRIHNILGGELSSRVGQEVKDIFIAEEFIPHQR